MKPSQYKKDTFFVDPDKKKFLPHCGTSPLLVFREIYSKSIMYVIINF